MTRISQISARISTAVEMFPGTHLLRLHAPEIAAEAKPGQFVMVRCGGETVLPRPFSIHRADDDSIAILFTTVGEGTKWLAARQYGETLDIFGPLGNGFTIAPDAKNLLLVAGGMGIAPLAFLAETALAQGKTVTMLVGARSVNCLLPLSVAQWCHEKGLAPGAVNVVNATEDGSEGYQGLVTELIVPYMNTMHALYACGPMPMYRSMVAAVPETDIPIQVSLETIMGCGTGVCYGCTVTTSTGPKQVCKDGPVFDWNDIRDMLAIGHLQVYTPKK